MRIRDDIRRWISILSQQFISGRLFTLVPLQFCFAMWRDCLQLCMQKVVTSVSWGLAIIKIKKKCKLAWVCPRGGGVFRICEISTEYRGEWKDVLALGKSANQVHALTPHLTVCRGMVSVPQHTQTSSFYVYHSAVFFYQHRVLFFP